MKKQVSFKLLAIVVLLIVMISLACQRLDTTDTSADKNT